MQENKVLVVLLCWEANHGVHTYVLIPLAVKNIYRVGEDELTFMLRLAQVSVVGSAPRRGGQCTMHRDLKCLTGDGEPRGTEVGWDTTSRHPREGHVQGCACIRPGLREAE